MRNIITKTAIAFTIVSMCVFALNKIQALKEENRRLLDNQEILLTQKEAVVVESQKYKVSDSLNAAKILGLQLTLDEYKKYRSQDLKLIEQLKIKKSDLQSVVSTQVETINHLYTKLQDSIQIDTVLNTIDTLRCFAYKSKWIDVNGCIIGDSIDLQIKNKESLIVVETAVHKRFLGFLWKTNKIKSRQIDVVSENPNTEIVQIGYVSIKP